MVKGLILNELKKYKNFRTDVEFSQFLGISPQCLKKWYDRDTFDLDILLKCFPEVSTDFLVGKCDALTLVKEKGYVSVNNSIVGGDNSTNTTNNDKSCTELMELLKKKDEQIDRLLSIIEKLNS